MLMAPLLADFDSVYSGKVGKSKILVYLNYNSNSEVIGLYKSLATGRRYYLKGHNKFKGRLVLTEYTKTAYGTKATADVTLRKTIVDGDIVWFGKMRNYDGRVVDMLFYKIAGN